MAIVTFVPLNKAKQIKEGATILAAATQCGVPIGQSCSGDGICGWCRVTVLNGIDKLEPPSAREEQLMRGKAIQADERAACLARVRGDVTVTTTYW